MGKGGDAACLLQYSPFCRATARDIGSGREGEATMCRCVKTHKTIREQQE